MTIHNLNNIYFRKKSSIVLNGMLIDLSNPLIFGILNVTPDSFYDGGKYQTEKAIIERARQIIDEGGAVIDIGAYSTRPGASEISADEELLRLLTAVRIVKREFPNTPISIDTFRSNVAEKIIGETGDCIINDISGGTLDPEMFRTVAKLHVPYVLMHIQGNPGTMQLNPEYKNVTKEVVQFLSKQVDQLHTLGVSDVIIDPGFGFGKNIDHNFELFKNLDAFRMFELPILVGLSRKSMLYKLLNCSPDESLNATTAIQAFALNAGADILRVHDVKPCFETIAIFKKINSF